MYVWNEYVKTFEKDLVLNNEEKVAYHIPVHVLTLLAVDGILTWLKAHNALVWYYCKIYRGNIFIGIKWKATTHLEQTYQHFGENWSTAD